MVFRLVQSARLKSSELLGTVRLASASVQRGVALQGVGTPKIWLNAGSRLVLRDQLILAPESFATALEVIHRVVALALHSEAVMVMGAGNGISVGSIRAASSDVIWQKTPFGVNGTFTDTDFDLVHPTHLAGGIHPSRGLGRMRIRSTVLIRAKSTVLNGSLPRMTRLLEQTA